MRRSANVKVRSRTVAAALKKLRPTERDARTGKARLKGMPAKGAVHRWSLRYDPKGNNNRGVITVDFDATGSTSRPVRTDVMRL